MSAFVGDYFDWLRYLGSFALVMVLLGITLFALKQLSGRVGNVSTLSHRLRVVEDLRIGSRHRLLMVEVGQHRVLVGMSPEGLRTLAQFPEGTLAVDSARSKSAVTDAGGPE